MEIAIVTFLILVTTGFGLYRWQRNPPNESKEPPPPRGFSGLFPADASATREAEHAAAEAQAAQKAAELRGELLVRAAEGDLACLSEAQVVGGAELYSEVMNSLIQWASGRQERLRDIVSYIVKHPELRANKGLADSVIAAWVANPSGQSAVDVIHLAALADDGQIYLTAVEAAVRLWREGNLPRLSAAQLHQLVESQYWLMSSEARRSGPRFALKQEIGRLRDELASPLSDAPK